MDKVKSVTGLVNTRLDSVMSYKYISIIVNLIIVLYAAQMGPTLPGYLQSVLKHTIGKVLFITLIIFVSTKDIATSLLMSIVFVLAINAVSGRPLLESMVNVKEAYVKDPESKARLIEPKTMINFGCLDIKADALLAVFEGNASDMQKTVRSSFQELMAASKDKPSKERLMAMARRVGLPYNMELNDQTAPYIATILTMWGYDFGGKCN